MSLKYIDSFDHYATGDLAKKGWTGAGSATIGASAGRRGGGALQLAAGASATRSLGASVSILIVGAAMAFSANADSDILLLKEGGTTHVQICLRSDGKLEAKRNGTSLGVSANALASPTSFHYYEAKVTLDDTAGAVTVNVDGVPVITLTSQDTRNAGTGVVDTVVLSATGLTVTVDDLYIADTSGATNNDFLGDIRIDCIYPNGAGTYQDFTPSTGSDHAAVIDEATPNGTDYLTGGAAGTHDTATFTDLSVTGTILGVQINNDVAKSSSGTCTVKNLIRSGGTNAYGGNADPAASYAYITSMHEIDPATSAAWTVAAVNAVEAGLEVVA